MLIQQVLDMPYNCLLCRDEGQDGEIISEKFGIFLDFETDTVTPDVTNQLHVQLGVAISKAEEMMVSFGEYGDGGKQIICDLTTNPSEEKQEEAWSTLCGLVQTLARCKQVSDDLTNFVPEILGQIWCGLQDSGGGSPGVQRKSWTVIIQEHMFLMLQLGKILDIAMRFDAKKIATMSISNDISYVKRQLMLRQKSSRSGVVEDRFKDCVNIQNLEVLSMYFISATPALSNIISNTMRVSSSAQVRAQELELIVAFCKICERILSSELRANFQKFGTIGMVQRIMVATALLYDHLSTAGIFCKGDRT